MTQRPLVNPTKTVTVRQFDGGLNVIDNQLNLSPRYAPILDNWMRASDGSLQVRWGYQLVADISKALSNGQPIVKGNIIAAVFFQSYLVIATDQGELGRLQISNSVLTAIWNNTIAAGQSGAPAGWSNPTSIVTFYTFGGKLIAMNGINKPLQIDFTASPVCQYQFDPASNSNSAIPIAKYGAVLQAYAVLGGEATTGISKPTQLDISAKLVASVYATNTSPADAFSADMSKLTPATDATITGLGVVRSNLLITYKNAYTIAKLGIYSGTVHQPDFSDNIGQLGCIGGRTIQTIGGDIIMCDAIGVPKLSPNNLGNQLQPSRVSDFIEPLLQKNLARLSGTTLETKAFSVYNPKDKQYMLFMPKFDNTPILLDVDPITFVPDSPTLMFISLREHDMAPGDPVRIAGAIAVGNNPPAMINITSTVYSVPDENTITVSLGSTAVDTNSAGGGTNVTLTPLTNETIGYILSYNPTLKVQSWSRFLGMSLSWGVTDPYGNLYIGKGTKVYIYGNPENPITGDAVGDYNYVYAAGTNVVTNDVVLDIDTGKSWNALASYQTTQTSFAAERLSNPNNWELSAGVPISFTWEWPWADFGQRALTKKLNSVHIDADGAGAFNFSIFVDNLYREGKLGLLQPQRQMQFTAGQRGFGHGPQTFGGGRATAEEVVYPLPTLCKLYKLRFDGATTQPLRIVAVTLLYNIAGVKR